jgi:hypothetical protein
VRLVDGAGNQIGDAEYVYTRQEAEAVIQRLATAQAMETDQGATI